MEPALTTVAKVRVLGLGNVLMGDDAFGPWVIHELERRFDMPTDVSLEDLGTPGLDLLPYLAGARAVILVDTVRGAGEPGELKLYDRDQLRRFRSQPRLTPHDPALSEALTTLELCGCLPPSILLIGAEPASVKKGVGLSPELHAAVMKAVIEVCRQLIRLDCPPRPRPEPSTLAPWWEAPVLARAPGSPRSAPQPRP